VGAALKKRLESNNGGRTHVLSAYDRAYDQKCEGSKSNGCDVIMTGGGGGWKDGSYFGFTAVHLMDDGCWRLASCAFRSIRAATSPRLILLTTKTNWSSDTFNSTLQLRLVGFADFCRTFDSGNMFLPETASAF